jgi:Na+/citrate or Na+/malate symporter
VVMHDIVLELIGRAVSAAVGKNKRRRTTSSWMEWVSLRVVAGRMAHGAVPLSVIGRSQAGNCHRDADRP